MAKNPEAHKLHSRVKMQTVLHCILCGATRRDEGITKGQFAAESFDKGWRYQDGWGGHPEGPICPECAQKPINKR